MGLLLIVIGMFVSVASIGSIDAAKNMGGPMAISFSPLVDIFSIGVGVVLIHYGAVMLGISAGKPYLLLSVMSFGYVVSNVWRYPSTDGAYYMLRYGAENAELFNPPSSWEHVIALICVGVVMYFGLTKTLLSRFSFVPDTRWWAVMYRSAILLVAGGLFLALGLLYQFFSASLNSGGITESHQHINMLISFFIPIGLLIVSLVVRKYDKISLVLSLSSCLTLVLLSLSFWV